MGWESRKGHGRYYTRSRKVHGRVVREYIGKGLVGEIASELDAEARAARAAEARSLRQDRDRLKPLDKLITELDVACRLIMEGTLLVTGFHRHSNEWRRRRDRDRFPAPAS